MSRTKLMAMAVAGLLGVGVAVLPGGAAGSSPPTTGSFTAVDTLYGGYYTYAWEASGGGNTVTIAEGGTVTFSYPSGVTTHNADFGSAAVQCTQTSGTNSGSVPPLPHTPTAPSWSGSCTFNTPGTYAFHDDHYTNMTGSVVVDSTTTTTGTTGTTGTTTGTGPTTSTQTTSGPPSTTTGSTTSTSPTAPTGQGGSPLAGAASNSVLVAPSQRGSTIRGTLRISQAGSGGSLQVTAFASPTVLRQSATASLVAVARRTLRLHSGTFRFSLALSATARRALLRRHRIKVQLRITVTAPAGTPVRVSRSVLLIH